MNHNNKRLVTLAEHTSDHGKQTNSSTKKYEYVYHIENINYVHSKSSKEFGFAILFPDLRSLAHHQESYMNEGIHLDLDTWIVPGHI